ncbi:MAG TPA: hypothetical protein VNF47_18915 [Streptosporangiaceae bacterium]|nr:hypothetical protein [Streptosporangiaceae bacterium]
MRDPDLVFKAQLAASALESAWHRWRVVHGLTSDPMPTVSSYVGYSLEEPWGQPRVVFGLAAEDAEQLTALLERHDCVGPVYATVTALPGSPAGQDKAGIRPGLPLPVPRQAPPAVAETAAAYLAESEPAEPEITEPGVAEPGVAEPGTGQPGTGQPGTVESGSEEPDVPQDGAEVGIGDAASASAGPAEAAVPAVAASSAPARDLSSDSDDLALREQAGSAAEQAAGPLAQAASAARVEAEARIRAALLGGRSMAKLENPYPQNPYPGDDFDIADLPPLADRDFAAAEGPAQRPAAACLGSRPDSDGPAVARSAPAESPDGRPGRAGRPVARQAPDGIPGKRRVPADGPGPRHPAEDVRAGTERPQDDDDEDDDADAEQAWQAAPISGNSWDGRDEAGQASAAKRNRMTRSYSIPRLSKSKRSGAIPGA